MTWKLVPGPFVSIKDYHTSIGKIYLMWFYWIHNSKTIKICQKQHAEVLRFLFIEDSFKIKKNINYIPGHIFEEFFDGNFFLQYYITLHYITSFHLQNIAGISKFLVAVYLLW